MDQHITYDLYIYIYIYEVKETHLYDICRHLLMSIIILLKCGWICMSQQHSIVRTLIVKKHCVLNHGRKILQHVLLTALNGKIVYGVRCGQMLAAH